MLRAIDKLLDGGMVQIIADKDPPGVGEAIDNDEEVVLVGKVEKGKVDKYDDMTVGTELLDQGSLVFHDGDAATFKTGKQRLPGPIVSVPGCLPGSYLSYFLSLIIRLRTVLETIPE